MVSLKQFYAVVQPWVEPLLLLIQAILPIYFIGLRLTVYLVATITTTTGGWGAFAPPPAERHHQVATAVVFDFLLGLLLLLWLVPLLYASWSWHVVARRHVFNTPERGETMQIEKGTTSRRYCTKCKAWKGDRTYHAKPIGRCLPYFDHTCFWWAGGVWVHNVKAYLLMIAFIPVYQVYCMTIGIWVLATQEYRYVAPYVALLVVSGLCSVYSFGIANNYWSSMIMWNMLTSDDLWAEQRYFLIRGRRYTWETRDATKCPWDLGWRTNLWLIMGPWYTVLFFWTTTPLMEAAARNRYPLRHDLNPRRSELQDLVPPQDRRRAARSTGADV